jgi:hypothetical protein
LTIATVTNQGKVRFMIYTGGLSPQRLIVVMRRLTRDAEREELSDTRQPERA